MTLLTKDEVDEATYSLLTNQSRSRAVLKELQIGVMAAVGSIESRDALNLARDMYELNGNQEDATITIESPYFLDTKEQQWKIRFSMGMYSVTCRCGFNDNGQMYLIADIPDERRKALEGLITPAAA